MEYLTLSIRCPVQAAVVCKAHCGPGLRLQTDQPLSVHPTQYDSSGLRLIFVPKLLHGCKCTLSLSTSADCICSLFRNRKMDERPKADVRAPPASAAPAVEHRRPAAAPPARPSTASLPTPAHPAPSPDQVPTMRNMAPSGPLQARAENHY